MKSCLVGSIFALVVAGLFTFMAVDFKDPVFAALAVVAMGIHILAAGWMVIEAVQEVLKKSKEHAQRPD